MIKLKESIDIKEILDELNDIYYSRRKESLDKDKIKIDIAKTLAKKYKLKYQDILSNIHPDGNISGFKTWDSRGNIMTIK